MDTYCADKFDKFDQIDNNNLKIDNYRLLTTYPFIDFYRFPIQLTNFYRCYQLLSIIGFIDWTSQDCHGWLHKPLSRLQVVCTVTSSNFKVKIAKFYEFLLTLRLKMKKNYYNLCTSFQSRRMFHFENTAIWPSCHSARHQNRNAFSLKKKSLRVSSWFSAV